MPTYLYETIPAGPDEAIERFEVRQRFDEAPLAVHPASGAPVRRVISGGLGLVMRGTGDAAAPDDGPACGPESCTCGRFT